VLPLRVVAINREKLDILSVTWLIGHADARILLKTYFREETTAIVEATKQARGW
jgi:hypothetical protein